MHAAPLGERGRGEVAAREAAHRVDQDVDPLVAAEDVGDEGGERACVGAAMPSPGRTA